MTDDPLERHKDDFARELSAAAARPARRSGRAPGRRTRRAPRGSVRPAPRVARRWAVAGTGTLVAAGVAVGLLLAGGGSIDVAGEAEAALTPAGAILHYRVRTTWERPADDPAVVPPGVRACAQTGATEAWVASSPLRWRVVLPGLPEGCSTRMFDRHGRLVRGPQELSWADGAVTTYVPANGSLDVVRGYARTGSAARVPLSGSAAGRAGSGDQADPVGTLRRMLASGELRDAGERRRDGRRVRVLAGRTTMETGQGGRRTDDVTYEVDAETFRPLRTVHALRFEGGRNPALAAAMSSVERTTFEVYERLPRTATTERLLAIHPAHPLRSVTDLTVGQLRRELRQDAPRRVDRP